MKKTGETFVFICYTFISYGYFCLKKNEGTFYLCVCVCVCSSSSSSRFMYVFEYICLYVVYV